MPLCCKKRGFTLSKPYNLYSAIDSSGSVLFDEPINPYYLILKVVCVIYATAVITWSMADLAEQGVSYSLWFAFRINWITLLIWIYFILSLFISICVNVQKRRGSSTEIPSFTEWEPELDSEEENQADFKRLKTYKLYTLHQLSRLCLQLSLSAIIFMSILYYIDYKDIFDKKAIPEFVLNIQTHGILAIGLCVDYFTSCVQIRYIYGSFLVLFFNTASIVWTYIFYKADLFNPITNSNVLYPVADWTNTTNFFSIFEIWCAGMLAHWFIHMVMVYLKFGVICMWIDRRHFTMDIIDEKEEARLRAIRDKKRSKKANKLEQRNANKLTNYEFEPLLL